ncbi:hypothetical protein L484_020494 [Morus notabilis]|uniref:Uncharacterized protein n=1 Tax=Morus notabilis TaxID=981085 RepID=W9SBM9_9ROSA|nr:hypothetical protein L484_020494 [Morus notabilis]
MDLLVNEMGWKPADIAGVPNVLHYGLQRWIVPRCSVIRVLLSKDLIKEKPSLSSVFVSTKENFLKNFVIPYQEQVPKLLRIFHGENESLKWG